MNASRGRFLLTWVVRSPPGWALPCESPGLAQASEVALGKEKSTTRDREGDRQAQPVLRALRMIIPINLEWTVCAEPQRQEGFTNGPCHFVQANSGQMAEGF